MPPHGPIGPALHLRHSPSRINGRVHSLALDPRTTLLDALREHVGLTGTEIDERNARYINDNLADYLAPVNADVQSIDVIFVAEIDRQINPLGVKGLGELGNVGTNAAAANAAFSRHRSALARLADPARSTAA
jgi:hypothetical protein